MRSSSATAVPVSATSGNEAFSRAGPWQCGPASVKIRAQVLRSSSTVKSEVAPLVEQVLVLLGGEHRREANLVEALGDVLHLDGADEVIARVERIEARDIAAEDLLL